MGGSIEEPFFRSILARNLAKFLCFNRDFEVAPKIGVLPPRVGGSAGGTYFRFRGEWGGALPPYSDRASYTPTLRVRIRLQALGKNYIVQLKLIKWNGI